MTSLNSSLKNKSLYQDVTITTSASGNALITLPSGYTNPIPILAFIMSSTSGVFTALIARYSGNYYVRILDSNLSAVASTEFTIRIVYITQSTSIS